MYSTYDLVQKNVYPKYNKIQTFEVYNVDIILPLTSLEHIRYEHSLYKFPNIFLFEINFDKFTIRLHFLIIFSTLTKFQ